MKYCVYTHSLDGVVFYVGSGVPSRPHCLTGRSALWREACDGRAGDVEVRIVSRHSMREGAYAAEAALIAKLRPSCNVRYNPAHTIQSAILRLYKRAVKVAAECGLVKVSFTKIADECGCTVTHVARVVKGSK